MSNDHINAVRKCNKFTGNTRLLLFVLADRASNGEGKGQSPRDYGWSWAGISKLMKDTGIKCRDTITDCLAKLQAAGVIKRVRRIGTSSRTFVDIDALRALAYDNNGEEEVKGEAEAEDERSDDEENFLHLDDGIVTACAVGESPATNAGEVTAIIVGKVPVDNPKQQPSATNPKVFNSSESNPETPDPDLDMDRLERQRGAWLPCKSNGEVSSRDNAGSKQEFLLSEGIRSDSEYELLPLSSLNVQTLFSCHGNVPVCRVLLTPSCAFPLSPVRDPELDDYEESVHLCAMWWAIQQRHSAKEEPEDQSGNHPWGHPRTWTVEQRREMFRKRKKRQEEGSRVPADSPEPTDDDQTSADHEQTMLADEKAMASLYYNHGFHAVKEVLEWLPTSTYWYQNPETRLNSLRQLCAPGSWQAVSQARERYFAKAVENGSEDDCELYVQGIFVAAGGEDVEQFCHDRLNPVDPLEAAEEEEMYLLDYIE